MSNINTSFLNRELIRHINVNNNHSDVFLGIQHSSAYLFKYRIV